MQRKIVSVVLPFALRHPLDYLAPCLDSGHLLPGMRVRVPFRSRIVTGLVFAVKTESPVPLAQLREVVTIVDERPLFSAEDYALCCFAMRYYHALPGELFWSALPPALRAGKPLPPEVTPHSVSNTPGATELMRGVETSPASWLLREQPLALNAAQQIAMSTVLQVADQFQVHCLYGVTGSGKTEVYLQIIASVLAADRQVLVLVPEIGLTPQTLNRVRARFTVPVALMHSGIAARERLSIWQGSRAGTIKVIIGTRSAVFIPFARLGLVIVDEEHDLSFKQQHHCPYHARDLAIMRAQLQQVPVVLGSATPSSESWLNSMQQRYRLLHLPERAGQASMPNYQLVDLRHTTVKHGIAAELLSLITQHVQTGNQVLLFLNRRGFAPILYCTACHWTPQCQHCAMRYVYHRVPIERLQCHYCGASCSVPRQCGACHATALTMVGIGTQRLAAYLKACYPEIPIIRIDRDSTRTKGALQATLAEVQCVGAAVLLGTQMLAKGHHFPRITLVGVIDADGGLLSADFRAAERFGQCLFQVGGRAGRADRAGTVVIQTRYPDHPYLQTLLHDGYAAFLHKLLAERQAAALPPYAHLALLRAMGHERSNVHAFLLAVAQALTAKLQQETQSTLVYIYGPLTCIPEQDRGWYREQLLLKSTCRHALQHALRMIATSVQGLAAYGVKWVLDVDPVSFF